jgi:hypothetical protein
MAAFDLCHLCHLCQKSLLVSWRAGAGDEVFQVADTVPAELVSSEVITAEVKAADE